jgi:hypothetical protein
MSSRSKGLADDGAHRGPARGIPHDPGAQGSGCTVSDYTHPSQHRGRLRGFGGVPGLPPGGAPDGDERDRGRLSLIATIRQEVLGVSGDPDLGQQRLPVHLLQR